MRSYARILLCCLFTALLPALHLSAAGGLEVHFIDVGQGDSILIRAVEEDIAILVDAGDAAAGQTVISYLKRAGVTRITHLVATHPHADHIGGMPAVIREFPIDRVFMPRATHTTRTYENLLLAIRAKGLRITEAKAGVTVVDMPGLNASFVGPVGSGYDELNNYSAVLMVRYRDTRFLFTGDAEAHSEGEMVRSGVSLQADVLKVGHHGSRTSTTAAFLDAVGPGIAVIPCGRGNSYGHPHAGTLARLERAGVQVFRTDLQGHIVITSDGERVAVTTARAAAPPAAGIMPDASGEGGTAMPDAGQSYVGNRRSKVFHSPGCASVADMNAGNAIKLNSRESAVAQGYRPCGRCRP